jgi:hypothetical protein
VCFGDSQSRKDAPVSTFLGKSRHTVHHDAWLWVCVALVGAMAKLEARQYYSSFLSTLAQPSSCHRLAKA